jgi:ribulose-phosphate 3-epimerase
MKVTICPTVLAGNRDDYREQIERIAPFATRVHIDLADGVFAPSKTMPLEKVWWPHGVHADLHVMYQRPSEYMKTFLHLAPKLIIIHAEAEGEFRPFASTLHGNGIKVGVALKPHTQVAAIKEALHWIDHVLVFSGNLGHFGGQANTHLLTKVLLLRKLKPTLEIGWDGGINNQNANLLASAGVNVLNVGGFIQHAKDPHAAYDELVNQVASSKKR